MTQGHYNPTQRTLVTGGAGFLGSRLFDHPHFELMRHDVTFPLYGEVDPIHNLACPAQTGMREAVHALAAAEQTRQPRI